MNTITIQIRSVYGRNKAYPVCDKAKIFANMLGFKTLPREALNHITALGYTVYMQGYWKETGEFKSNMCLSLD